MVGDKDTQVDFMWNSAPDPFVPEDHPLRRIRPLIDEQAIRRECAPLYSKVGRPSVPPEQLFLALLAGYLMGVRSERRPVTTKEVDLERIADHTQADLWRSCPVLGKER